MRSPTLISLVLGKRPRAASADAKKNFKRIIILQNENSPFWDAARAGLQDAENDLKLRQSGLRAVLEVNNAGAAGQVEKLQQFGTQPDIVGLGISASTSRNGRRIFLEVVKKRDEGEEEEEEAAAAAAATRVKKQKKSRRRGERRRRKKEEQKKKKRRRQRQQQKKKKKSSVGGGVDGGGGGGRRRGGGVGRRTRAGAAKKKRRWRRRRRSGGGSGRGVTYQAFPPFAAAQLAVSTAHVAALTVSRYINRV